MPFCALLQKCPLGVQKVLARPGPPMMDLSSLDGPPIFDPRNTITSGPIDFSSLDGGPVIADSVAYLPPNPTVPCIQRPPTPQTDAQYHLLSKPLPQGQPLQILRHHGNNTGSSGDKPASMVTVQPTTPIPISDVPRLDEAE
ncbi:hypothetical protein N7504_007874 [Penicillium tannophilum]|nr:hypothetical protein N7504_007874 [Penicillium tannophilum]